MFTLKICDTSREILQERDCEMIVFVSYYCNLISNCTSTRQKDKGFLVHHLTLDLVKKADSQLSEMSLNDPKRDIDILLYISSSMVEFHVPSTWSTLIVPCLGGEAAG